MDEDSPRAADAWDSVLKTLEGTIPAVDNGGEGSSGAAMEGGVVRGEGADKGRRGVVERKGFGHQVENCSSDSDGLWMEDDLGTLGTGGGVVVAPPPVPRAFYVVWCLVVVGMVYMLAVACLRVSKKVHMGHSEHFILPDFR